MTDISDRATFWPKWIEKKTKQRVLSGLNGSLLVTEHDQQFEVWKAEDIIRLLFEQNLILFIRKFNDLPEMDVFLQASKESYCDKEGRFKAYKFEGARRKTHWIVAIESWDYIAPVAGVLKELRITFDHCGVGVQTTAGGLGQATMRKSLKDQYGDDWYQHRHRRPGHPSIQILRAHSFGARQDAIDVTFHAVAYELDMKNAYSFHFRKLPTGICSRTYGDECFDHLTCFVPVRVTIKKTLHKIGLFPVRNEDKSISYPATPGTYDTWLWREHIDFLKENGLKVEVTGPGLAWDEWTNDLEYWSLMMEHLRDTAPNEATARHIKLATVAGIGRQNLPDEHYIIRENGELGVDRPLVSDGCSWDWWVHKTIDENPVNLPHWYFYGVAMCALTLTQMMLTYQDYLIGSATDAVYVREDAPGLDQFPSKDVPDLASGTWRLMKHTNVRRWKIGRFKSDQKTVLTGVPRDGRTEENINKLMEEAG